MGVGPIDEKIIEDTEITTGKVIFYVVMASLFNMGWASV
jgi:hypothetical protein